MHICMVAERNLGPASPQAMDRTPGAARRQPSLAEDIDEIEREHRVTRTLQAVEAHGML